MKWEYRVEYVERVDEESPNHPYNQDYVVNYIKFNYSSFTDEHKPGKYLVTLLNELGSVGWELVGIIPNHGGDYNVAREGATLLLKRGEVKLDGK